MEFLIRRGEVLSVRTAARNLYEYAALLADAGRITRAHADAA
jgi:hypothetical protein